MAQDKYLSNSDSIAERIHVEAGRIRWENTETLHLKSFPNFCCYAKTKIVLQVFNWIEIRRFLTGMYWETNFSSSSSLEHSQLDIAEKQEKHEKIQRKREENERMTKMKPCKRKSAVQNDSRSSYDKVIFDKIRKHQLIRETCWKKMLRFYFLFSFS